MALPGQKEKKELKKKSIKKIVKIIEKKHQETLTFDHMANVGEVVPGELVGVVRVDDDEVADHSTVNYVSMSDEQGDAEDSIVSAMAAENTAAAGVILM